MIASATVGSGMSSYHCSTSSWLATTQIPYLSSSSNFQIQTKMTCMNLCHDLLRSLTTAEWRRKLDHNPRRARFQAM